MRNKKKGKRPKPKLTFMKDPFGIMVPQIDLGYKTDAVKEIRKMRDYRV